MHQLTISLNDEDAAFVRACIEGGDYGSLDALFEDIKQKGLGRLKSKDRDVPVAGPHSDYPLPVIPDARARKPAGDPESRPAPANEPGTA